MKMKTGTARLLLTISILWFLLTCGYMAYGLRSWLPIPSADPFGDPGERFPIYGTIRNHQKTIYWPGALGVSFGPIVVLWIAGLLGSWTGQGFRNKEEK